MKSEISPQLPKPCLYYFTFTSLKLQKAATPHKQSNIFQKEGSQACWQLDIKLEKNLD
jgi:cytochrome c551/c552